MRENILVLVWLRVSVATTVKLYVVSPEATLDNVPVIAPTDDSVNPPGKPPEDTVLPPQIELNEFFKTLKSPFHAYEADDPKSLAAAIADINQKEKKPIRYTEQIPGKDFSSACFLIAALMIGLLLGVKYWEVKSWD